MTDLKKYCPNTIIGEGKIEVTNQDLRDLIEKWKAIDAERNKKRKRIAREAWEKIKDRIVN